MTTELLTNLDKIHTTTLGLKRIRKNLSLDAEDVICWCKGKIENADSIIRRGKNWYVHADNMVITINAHSFTIITAHKDKVHSRDDYLESVTIGKREPHNAEITLAEYNPNWPVLFEQEAERIREALGGKARNIHHVGSTSVPGLCAKPIIDMLLVVNDSADESNYVPDLEASGYILRIREPEWFQHRLFKGPGIDINLHIFSEGTAEIERMLCFRDWLRNHEDDRELYAKTKRELARQIWQHVQYYADAKTAVIQEIMERALANMQ